MSGGKGLIRSLPGVVPAGRWLRERLYRRPMFRKRWAETFKRLQSVPAAGYNRAWGEARRRMYRTYGVQRCPRRQRVRLRSLRGRYAGKRVFVLGSGPSLNRTPLEKLAGEYTFGTNRIYLLYDRVPWRLSFYTVLDWLVGPDNADEINALSDGTTFFFPHRFWGLLRTGSDVYWYHSIDRGGAPGAQFSRDLTRGARAAGTVTGTALQIAAYLGFAEIYLVGCDGRYGTSPTVRRSDDGEAVRPYLEGTADDDPGHFDPRYLGRGKRWHPLDVQGMMAGYRSCRAALEAMGVRVGDATVGGALDVFEKVDFDSLF